MFFYVKKFQSATSLYLYVYTNAPGIKSKIPGFIWQVAPESKSRLVSSELSPKYLLGLSALEDICSIETYIFCNWLRYILFTDVLSIFIDLHARVYHFCATVVFLSNFFCFQKICDKMILLSTSEYCIWFPNVTVSTLIIRVAWIEGWFIMALIPSLLIKNNSFR